MSLEIFGGCLYKIEENQESILKVLQDQEKYLGRLEVLLKRPSKHKNANPAPPSFEFGKTFKPEPDSSSSHADDSQRLIIWEFFHDEKILKFLNFGTIYFGTFYFENFFMMKKFSSFSIFGIIYFGTFYYINLETYF